MSTPKPKSRRALRRLLFRSLHRLLSSAKASGDDWIYEAEGALNDVDLKPFEAEIDDVIAEFRKRGGEEP